jgi:hypothetical protein
MIPITGKRFGPSQSFGKRPIRSPRGFISLLHREPLEAPYACWQARSGASPAATAEGSLTGYGIRSSNMNVHSAGLSILIYRT